MSDTGGNTVSEVKVLQKPKNTVHSLGIILHQSKWQAEIQNHLGTVLQYYCSPHPIMRHYVCMNRLPINADNDDDNHYEALVEKQTKADRDYDTFKDTVSIPIGSTVAV